MRTIKESARSLDKLDLKILSVLQNDGRISIKELAERIGLSITPCAERVKRMEADGVIQGYYAKINPVAVGAKLLVFVEITLDQKSGEAFSAFRREVLRIPEVLECHLVSGDFDYLIKARIREMAEYRELLGGILLQLPGAAQSKSYVVMEEIKESFTIAIATQARQRFCTAATGRRRPARSPLRAPACANLRPASACAPMTAPPAAPSADRHRGRLHRGSRHSA